MNRIIILIILLINFVSCNSQQGKAISNFEKLDRIQFQIDNHTTNEKSYTTLDSLRKVIDGADAELYVETYKNAIIYDTYKFLNYLEKKHEKIDENVLAFFKQDEKIFKLIDEKLKRNNKNIKKGYIKDSNGYTNLRKYKNKNSEIIQKVIQNEEITVLDDSDDWYLVETKEKNKGYIYNSRIINNLEKIAIIHISPKWKGKYSCNFLRMKEESADPRAYAMIYINIENDSATFQLESYLEDLNKELLILSCSLTEIILVEKNNKNSKFTITKNNRNFQLKSDLLNKTIGEISTYELVKK